MRQQAFQRLLPFFLMACTPLLMGQQDCTEVRPNSGGSPVGTWAKRPFGATATFSSDGILTVVYDDGEVTEHAYTYDEVTQTLVTYIPELGEVLPVTLHFSGYGDIMVVRYRYAYIQGWDRLPEDLFPESAESKFRASK